MSANATNFGEFFLKKREEKRITLRKMAELLGIILSDGGFHSSALFSLLIPVFGVEIRDLSWNAPYFVRGRQGYDRSFFGST